MIFVFVAINSIFIACSMSDSDGYTPVYVIGDVLPHDGKTIRILTDGQDTVTVTNSERFYEDLEDYNRVFATGQLISSEKKNDIFRHEVRVERMSEIRTIKPSLATVIDADSELADKGEDGVINLDDAYILSKYLTIEYTRWYDSDNFKDHEMYLVVDNYDDAGKGFPAVENGVLKLSAELRHRANGDKPVNIGKYILSVDIDEYIKNEDVNTILIDLKYKKSDNSYRVKEGIKWKR